MKILIINSYSAGNRGDAAIVVSMIKLIRKQWHDAEISVMSSYWLDNENFYNRYNAKSIQAIWQLVPGSGFFSRYLTGLSKLIKLYLRPTSNEFACYKNADLVLSAGGGYLYSSKKGAFGIGLLNALFHYWVAIKLDKKVIGFPQSVGPLKYKADKFITKSVLSRLTKIYSREPGTTSTLRKWKLTNFSEVMDVAFTLEASESKTFLTGVPKIGLTVLDWKFAYQNANDEDILNYLNKISITLKKLLETDDQCSIYVFPQVEVTSDDSDLAVSQKIVALTASDRCRVYSLADTTGPEDVIEIYGQMSCFIASRMHSSIFALSAGIPTVALSYQPKTTGTFKLLNIDSFAIDTRDFSSERLYELIMACLNKKQIDIRYRINNAQQCLLDDIKRIANQ